MFKYNTHVYILITQDADLRKTHLPSQSRYYSNLYLLSA